jgi:hypothetical protein
MKKSIKGLALAAMIALSLLASASSAFAKDTGTARENAWTAWADVGPLPARQGVTWEWILKPVGVSWEE